MAVGYHYTDGFGLFTVDSEGRRVSVERPPATLTADLGFDEAHPTVHCEWSPTGSALYLEVTPNELSTIWKVPAHQYRLEWAGAERLTTGPGNAVAFSVSPDGKRIAFTSDRRRSRAWVFPFDPVAGRLAGAGRPVTDEETTIGHLSLVPPDGRSILYTAWRAGRHESDVLVTDMETGTTRTVVPNARGASVSPSGASFTYMLARPRSRGDGAASVAPVDMEFALALRDRAGSEQLLSHWSSDQAMSVSDWTSDGTALLGTFWKPYLSGPASIALWRVSRAIRRAPEKVLLTGPTLRFWQAMYSPDDRMISFVVENTNRPGDLEIGVMKVAGDPQPGWTRIAEDHEWPDKPRWAPDGRTLYFISQKPTGYFNLWGVRIDPERAQPIGKPFQITHFNSPELAIDPDVTTSETDIMGGRLALTMSKAAGSIWTLSDINR
jgi:Tol biopolymer transport system component